MTKKADDSGVPERDWKAMYEASIAEKGADEIFVNELKKRIKELEFELSGSRGETKAAMVMVKQQMTTIENMGEVMRKLSADITNLAYKPEEAKNW